MYRLIIGILVLTIVLLSACKEKEIEVHFSGMPDAEEVLTLDPNADIFQWDDVVYKTEVDWVEELQLTKNKELGEITSVSSKPANFKYKNGMANKLPVGTKIYTAEERNDVLLVEFDGNIKKYLGMGEG